jgi:acetyl esterase/lipase
MRHLLIAAVALAAPATAQVPVAAISADPVRDVAHPARLVPVRYLTGGVAVPARMFVAAGGGTHPTVLLLHGFPGTELNLDLARVLQRAGWNVLAIHYRGVWGGTGPVQLQSCCRGRACRARLVAFPRRGGVRG